MTSRSAQHRCGPIVSFANTWQSSRWRGAVLHTLTSAILELQKAKRRRNGEMIILLNIGRLLMVAWVIYGLLLIFAPSVVHKPSDQSSGIIQVVTIGQEE